MNRKPKQKSAPPFKLKAKIYQKYFTADTSPGEIEAVIEQALATYFEIRKEQDIAQLPK